MANKRKKVDIGIITALPDIELPALLKVFNIDPHAKEDESLENYRYWFSTINPLKAKKDLSVVITSIGTSGNISSYAATNALIQNFNPDLLLFVGIAAGLEEKVDLVDVVISEKIIGYEPGRLTPNGVEHRPQYEHPPQHILQDVRFFTQQVDKNLWFDLFNKLQKTLSSDQLPSDTTTLTPRMHLASIASGEKLFANGSLTVIRKKYDEGIRAGEMEGLGFSMASDKYKIPWIIIRGISDFGNPLTKEGRLKDRYHHSAANSASSWVKLFLENAYTGWNCKSQLSDPRITLCNNLIGSIRDMIALHGLDDDSWAKAISSQYFLVGLAKILNLTEQKDYLNLLDRFLSSFHYNIKGELILEKDHILVTPEETEKIIIYMKEEDTKDNYYTQSKKMKAENINGIQMHNNYHYGLTLRIASSEKIQVLNEIKKVAINKLTQSDNCLDEYGGWYPYRIPWITARILISFKECDQVDISPIQMIIQRALDSLIRRIYMGRYWRSGVGVWVSKWESTALCLEALDKWNYVKQNEMKLKSVLRYVIENQSEWMVTPPNFSTEDNANNTLSSVVMTSVLLRVIKNNFTFEEFLINPDNYLRYFEECMSVIKGSPSPSVRQFCTIPQIMYYIADAVTNIQSNRGE